MSLPIKDTPAGMPALPVGRSGVMEIPFSVCCPFCGQSFELLVDSAIPQQSFVTDCEICCRPFEVVVECEPGEILSLEIRNC
jgi:hypothetical protein